MKHTLGHGHGHGHWTWQHIKKETKWKKGHKEKDTKKRTEMGRTSQQAIVVGKRVPEKG